MEQNNVSQSEVAAPDTQQQPQVFITNNTKLNLLSTVLGFVLIIAASVFLLVFIYQCVTREWYFLLMFILGMVTFVYPMYRLKEHISQLLSFATKYVKRSWIKGTIWLIGAALFFLSLNYICDVDNYDSKLIAGLLLYFLGGYLSSVLTYKVYKRK